MNKKIESCNVCNSTNLGIGYQMGGGQIYPDLYSYHNAKAGSVVEYIICKDCASIVHASVRNPELFTQYHTARQEELLEYIEHYGILLCNESKELPSLCGLGYTMENIISLIEQKKVFYCKAYKKRSTYLSVKAYQLFNRCFSANPLNEHAKTILHAMKQKAAVDKEELRMTLAMDKKTFDTTFDFLLQNLYITAIGGKKLNVNWYSYLYCTADRWKQGIEGLHFPGDCKDALWKIVNKTMSEKDFHSFVK